LKLIKKILSRFVNVFYTLIFLLVCRLIFVLLNLLIPQQDLINVALSIIITYILLCIYVEVNKYNEGKYALKKGETDYLLYSDLYTITEMLPYNKKERYNKNIHLLDPLISIFLKSLDIKLDFFNVVADRKPENSMSQTSKALGSVSSLSIWSTDKWEELFWGKLELNIFKYNPHFKKLYEKIDSDNDNIRLEAINDLEKLQKSGNYPVWGFFMHNPELYSSILFNTHSYTKSNPLNLKELEKIKNTLEFDMNANYLVKQKREFIKKALVSTNYLKEYVNQNTDNSKLDYYLDEIKKHEEPWLDFFFSLLLERERQIQ